MIRSFIAIALPEEVKSGLAGTSQKLKRLKLVGSFPKPESFHLTLKFLGDVEEAKVPEIGEAMRRSAEGVGGFDLEIGGVGVFPHLANPRVIWEGAENVPPLARLQQRLEEELEEIGFDREDRPFHPHLTLARLKGRAHFKELVSFVEGEGRKERAGTVHVTQVHLYQSILRPEGAQYRVLLSVDLQQQVRPTDN